MIHLRTTWKVINKLNMDSMWLSNNIVLYYKLTNIKIKLIFLVQDVLLVTDDNVLSSSFKSSKMDPKRTEEDVSVFKELFSNPASYKPFILLLLLFILMQSTGTFAIIFYAVNVFQGGSFNIKFSILVAIFSYLYSIFTYHKIHCKYNNHSIFLDVGATSSAYGAAILTGLLRTAGTFGGTLLLMRGIPRKVLN